MKKLLQVLIRPALCEPMPPLTLHLCGGGRGKAEPVGRGRGGGLTSVISEKPRSACVVPVISSLLCCCGFLLDSLGCICCT